MNKKAIIVIALFFFIGNAIAVRHVGYGAEVCGINIMPSDEDDYQKEIIAKFGDLYFDSSENPEETTSGMAMWCTQQEKRYKNNVVLYSAKLSSLPLQPTLKDSLKQETDCWNKLQASLNKFDAMYLRLYYYTGGTMGIICQADAPMNIAYIRMACLKDDCDLFANKQKPSFAKMKVIDTSVWNKELQEALATVKYETQDKELIKSYGSTSEYKQLYCQLEKYAVDTKTLLASWVAQRKNAEQLLSDSQQGNYRNHTLMVVNALAYHFYNNRMFGE
ncbi:hypothetical protein [Segatella copri]|uniref:hypothetical protein n=1 Tax=Segatella copri TaxID=165179 RepID=UPI00222FE59A|nr:hypothetical protein [Segatella copri]MCW4083215.1 hypothetical protein [Segatella copri]